MLKAIDNLRGQVLGVVNQLYPQLAISLDDIKLEHPDNESYGDLAVNIAFRISKQLLAKGIKESPQQVAEKLASQIVSGGQKPGFAFQDKSSALAQEDGVCFWSRVDAQNGFLNFWFSADYLISQLNAILSSEKPFVLPPAGKKIVMEIVSPNINKPLHVGHLRNAALGMSLAKIYEAVGWQVIKDEINNDRGLHIMKALYGYLLFGCQQPNQGQNWRELLGRWQENSQSWKTPQSEGEKPDHFVGNYYVLGERFLEENGEVAQNQLAEMLQAWEAEEEGIWRLWEVMSAWVHEGIDATYQRFGVSHDYRWYEHQLYREGKEIIADGVKKGLLEVLSDGAIQANLEKYGLANKILVRRDGTAIYVTFDLALTKHKVAKFQADKYVWVVGADQKDHFRRLFAIFDLLGLGKIDQFYHLAYGMVRLPEGKMSSRLGNVVLADDLLDKVKELAAKYNPQVAEEVAIGAVKYALLKVDSAADIVFDLEKSVSLEGDSGPYLQYTYARACSVLRKAEEATSGQLSSVGQFSVANLTSEELALLRWLPRFSEVLEQAAQNYAPNLLCVYLFELAKRFNSMYNNHQILESNFRLTLTLATSKVLKDILDLLGICSLEQL